MLSRRLAGKIALVTGSSSGLGRAIAVAFANEGARVCCVDLYSGLRNAIDPKTGKADDVKTRVSTGELTHEIIRREHGPDHATYSDAVKQCVAQFGRLDVLVNNAGISVESTHESLTRIHETSEEDYDKTMAINAKGIFLGCKYGIQHMLTQTPLDGKRGIRGWIVNTAGVQGLLGYYGTPSYCAAKHAAVGITRQVALDYAKDKIHCNCICPGFLQTAMTQNLQGDPETLRTIASQHPWGGGGLGDPEDVAQAAVYLASDDLRWITGIALPIDGGFSCQ